MEVRLQTCSFNKIEEGFSAARQCRKTTTTNKQTNKQRNLHSCPISCLDRSSMSKSTMVVCDFFLYSCCIFCLCRRTGTHSNIVLSSAFGNCLLKEIVKVKVKVNVENLYNPTDWTVPAL